MPIWCFHRGKTATDSKDINRGGLNAPLSTDANRITRKSTKFGASLLPPCHERAHIMNRPGTYREA